MNEFPHGAAEGRNGPLDSLAVDRAVLEAAALDTEGRIAFLRRTASDDPSLLDAVKERLEAAMTLPSAFLAVPAAALLDAVTVVQGERYAPVPLAAAGDRYELQEVLGQGGMATVQAAFDRQLQRRVALKLLYADHDGAGRERFLAEARAQARVRHHHVLEIYDTGELDGRPFLAMRWVDGGTLADLPPETPLEEKLRLVRQAALGLHAAHREGLIHRDVKPANLLLETAAGGARLVRVSDFGIAVDAGGPAAEVAGTPAFLAPELLDGSGNVDRRVDVYGLGVTLYRLLSGDLPFGGETVAEILDRIREGRPARLEEVEPSVPRDVSAIVHRCLEKDPQKRYGSARELAEDLRRFLDGEPVDAATSTLVYRLSKFAVRHRRLLAAGSLAAALVVVASWIAAYQGIAARAANEVAQVRRLQAEEMITFMLGDLRSKLDGVGRLDLLDDVGREALEYFAAVPASELSDGELGRRSQALYQIGEVRMARGQLRDAIAPLEESLALARTLSERAPDDLERLFALGQSEFWAGFALWKVRRTAEVRPHFETYLDVSRRLVAARPGDAGYRLELSYAHSNLASLSEEEGDLDGARAGYLEAVEINRALVDEAPDDPLLVSELAAAYSQLGDVEWKTGDLAASLDHYRRDLDLRRRLAELDPDDRRFRALLATSHDYLAAMLQRTGDLRGFRRHLGEARALLEELVAFDPAQVEWRYKLGLVHMRLARSLLAAGRTAEAAGTLDELRRQVESLGVSAEGPVDLSFRRLQASYACLLAGLYRRRGELAEARPAIDGAVADLEDLVADWNDLDAVGWLVDAYLESAEIAGAAGRSRRRDQALDRAGTWLASRTGAPPTPLLLTRRVRWQAARGLPEEAAESACRLRATGFADPAFWRRYGFLLEGGGRAVPEHCQPT